MHLVIAFGVALSITAMLIPLLARWAPALGLTDAPGPRKVHDVPVPRVGGLAMAAGIAVPVLLLMGPMSPTLQGFMAGFAILLGCGALDDRFNLHYGLKFVGQAAAVAICMVVGGVQIDTLTLGDEPLQLPGPISAVLTFVFLVGVTNAVNLADGLDGLAGGTALLCLCAIAMLAVTSGNTLATSLVCVEAGAILGFLRFNTHPARVFMGDAGSQVLGFTIGALAILATQSETAPYSAALPLLIVGLPILDTIAVAIQRMREGRSPFASDRSHLHHRLLALGFAHPEAVILIYLLQGALFLLAYFLKYESDMLIVAAFTGFAVGAIGVLRFAERRGWSAQVGGRPRGAVGMLSRLNELLPPERLGHWAAWAMAACLLIYAVLVVATAEHFEGDVALLGIALLLVLALLYGSRAERSLKWLERAAAYFGVGLLVYLDQTTVVRAAVLEPLPYVLFAIMGTGALVSLRFSPARRFELTSLDVLIVFIVLAIPNLPGGLALPAQFAGGIAKAIVLLYVVEMLLELESKRRVPRACVALTLAAIAVHGLVALSS